MFKCSAWGYGHVGISSKTFKSDALITTEDLRTNKPNIQLKTPSHVTYRVFKSYFAEKRK